MKTSIFLSIVLFAISSKALNCGPSPTFKSRCDLFARGCPGFSEARTEVVQNADGSWKALCMLKGCNSGRWSSNPFHTETFDSPCGSTLQAQSDGLDGGGFGAGPGVCQTAVAGSFVGVDNQVLGETIPLTGVDFSLVYRSSRTDGYAHDTKIRIPVTTSELRSGVTQIEVKIYDQSGTEVDSEIYNNDTLNITHEFVGSGLGTSSQIYKVVVQESGPASDFWPIVSYVGIGHASFKPVGLGGWVPSVWLFYDAKSNMLHYGDGRQRKAYAVSLSPGYRVAEASGTLVYEFNTDGYVTSIRHGLTGQTLKTFSYSGGQLVSITSEPGGKVTQFSYALGKIASITSPYGKVTTVTTDSNGFLSSVTSPAAEVYEMIYDPDGLMTYFEKPNGASSTFLYHPDGRLYKDTHSGGYEIAVGIITNSPMLRFNQLDTPMGRSTHVYHYYSAASSSTYYPDGTIMSSGSLPDNGYFVTSRGDGTSIFQEPDPRFGESAMTVKTRKISIGGSVDIRQENYDTVVDPSSPSDPFTFNSITKEMSLTGGAEHKFTSTYVASTKSWRMASPLSVVQDVKIDDFGRPSQVQRGNLLPVQLNYDGDQLTSVVQGDRVSRLGYNCDTGLLESSANALGEVTLYGYNSAERLTSVVFPDSRTISYSYDSLGRVASITPPGRPAYLFSLNSRELLETFSPPTLSGVPNVNTAYTYNGDNQVESVTRPDGRVLTYDYDLTTGQLKSIEVDDGVASQSYDYTYDFYTGKVKTIVGPVKYSNELSYDSASYIGTQYVKDGAATLWHFRTALHAPYLKPLTEQIFAGTVYLSIAYQYDADERLSQAGDLAITYRPTDGLLAETSIGNFKDFYGYNAYGEIQDYVGYSGSILSPTTYYSENLTRDAIGRVVSKTEIIDGVSSTEGYDYDETGRLIEVERNGITVSEYDYDDNGNRNGGFTNISDSISASLDDQDRMTAYGILDYAYNANGDLVSKTNSLTSEVTTYSYDVFGNLLSVDAPGTSGDVTYQIDGLNRRIGRELGASTIRWVYDNRGRIVGELNASGDLSRRYVYASKRNIPDYFIEYPNSTKFRIYSDHIGSPRVVVRLSDGTIMQKMEHDEFGRVRADTNPGYTPFGFAGGIYDPVTGLVRFGARDYDPQTGRWTSKDPIRFAAGDTNLYGYVMNDPVNLIDPDGKCPMCFGAVVGGIAAGVATYVMNPNASPSTIATAVAVGAVAGAASGGISASSSLGVIFGANAAIGYGANVATQVATGTPWGQVSQSSAIVAGIAGGIGGVAGLGAGTAAFYRTPVIGNAIGIGAAETAGMCSSTLTGAAVGVGLEVGIGQ